MVHRSPRTNKLATLKQRLAATRMPLLWGLLLWAVAVGLPYVLLFPEQGLNRPIVAAMALLPPMAMLAASLARAPQLLLGVGLASQVPVLVASPVLLGPRTSSAMQALTIGVLTLLFVAACFDVRTNADGDVVPVVGTTRLRRLFRWPEEMPTRVALGLAAVWLLMAWWVDAPTSDRGAALRTSRTAMVAVLWTMTMALPVGLQRDAGRVPRFERPGRLPESVVTLLLRRAVWVGLLVGALLWVGRIGDLP